MPLGTCLNDLKSSDPPVCVEEKTLKLFDRGTIAGQVDRDDDLTTINGRREQLEGKIQERYGLAKDQVRQDVDDWFASQGF